ncbi:hypothetical protein PAHAL_1G401900 [Panicum hallii]|uniref:Uncharacterized protein n=1 Tax=Panicum hallii TaxID=206008 RepID=A0A2T8KXW3_9POAL|nr:hypothetical protein PAHAL_1G401900 [Panicum hallii]
MPRYSQEYPIFLEKIKYTSSLYTYTYKVGHVSSFLELNLAHRSKSLNRSPPAPCPRTTPSLSRGTHARGGAEAERSTCRTAASPPNP